MILRINTGEEHATRKKAENSRDKKISCKKIAKVGTNQNKNDHIKKARKDENRELSHSNAESIANV